MRVVCAPADQTLLDFESGEALGLELLDHLLDFGHHFGANSVAGKKEEMIGGHCRFLLDEADGEDALLDDFAER